MQSVQFAERSLGGALTFADLSSEFDETAGIIDTTESKCPPAAEEELQAIANIHSELATLYNFALKGIPYPEGDVDETDWQRPVPLHLRLKIRLGLALCRAKALKLCRRLKPESAP